MEGKLLKLLAGSYLYKDLLMLEQIKNRYCPKNRCAPGCIGIMVSEAVSGWKKLATRTKG